mmetsp:Transcript_67776/g.116464  ORF Transcript_67776/g.116464 Transcript_67776/m.116464 type:complete len:447 (+) Transcript_67776:73-1413(+)
MEKATILKGTLHTFLSRFRGRTRTGAMLILTAVLVASRVVYMRRRSSIFGIGGQPKTCQAGRDSMLHAGSWIKVPNGTQLEGKLYPYCCGWDGGPGNFRDDPAHCGDSEVFKPALEYGAPFGIGITYRGQSKSPKVMTQIGGGCCSCQPLKQEYLWEPVECEVAPWDAKRFCETVMTEKAKGPFGAKRLRRLMIIGDGTTEEDATTLINMIKIGGGGCEGLIRSASCDHLAGQEIANAGGRGPPWWVFVDRFRPDFVVLNVGVHVDVSRFDAVVEDTYEKSLELRRSYIADYKNASAAKRKSMPRDLTVLWRTSHPGGCTKGLEDRSTEEFWKGYRGPPNNYPSFPGFDERATAFFVERGVPVVDLRMLYWRGDAHVGSQAEPSFIDCIHMCSRNTAVAQTFPRMLLHALATARLPAPKPPHGAVLDVPAIQGWTPPWLQPHKKEA